LSTTRLPLHRRQCLHRWLSRRWTLYRWRRLYRRGGLDRRRRQWRWRLWLLWCRRHDCSRPSHYQVDVKDAEVDSSDSEANSDPPPEQEDDRQATQIEQNDEVDDPVPERPKDDDNDPRVESGPLGTDEHRPACDCSTHRLRLLTGLRLLLLLLLNLLHLRNVQQRAAAHAAHARHSILIHHHCRERLQHCLAAVRLAVHVAVVEDSGVGAQPDGRELLDIAGDLVDANLLNTRPRRGLGGLLLKVVDQTLSVAR
jgi:hypothetical protein